MDFLDLEQLSNTTTTGAYSFCTGWIAKANDGKSHRISDLFALLKNDTSYDNTVHLRIARKMKEWNWEAKQTVNRMFVLCRLITRIWQSIFLRKHDITAQLDEHIARLENAQQTSPTQSDGPIQLLFQTLKSIEENRQAQIQLKNMKQNQQNQYPFIQPLSSEISDKSKPNEHAARSFLQQHPSLSSIINPLDPRWPEKVPSHLMLAAQKCIYEESVNEFTRIFAAMCQTHPELIPHRSVCEKALIPISPRVYFLINSYREIQTAFESMPTSEIIDTFGTIMQQLKSNPPCDFDFIAEDVIPRLSHLAIRQLNSADENPFAILSLIHSHYSGTELQKIMKYLTNHNVSKRYKDYPFAMRQNNRPFLSSALIMQKNDRTQENKAIIDRISNIQQAMYSLPLSTSTGVQRLPIDLRDINEFLIMNIMKCWMNSTIEDNTVKITIDPSNTPSYPENDHFLNLLNIHQNLKIFIELIGNYWRENGYPITDFTVHYDKRLDQFFDTEDSTRNAFSAHFNNHKTQPSLTLIGFP